MGIRIAVIAALGALIFAGCSGSGVSSGDIEASQANERWELRLQIPGEVRAGEMTTVELSLKNVSDETLQARRDCVSTFDLTVANGQGEIVFDWQDHVIETKFKGTAPQCPLTWTDLAPGEALEETLSFLVDEPGEYTVSPQPPREEVGSTSVPIDLSLSVEVGAR